MVDDGDLLDHGAEAGGTRPLCRATGLVDYVADDFPVKTFVTERVATDEELHRQRDHGTPGRIDLSPMISPRGRKA